MQKVQVDEKIRRFVSYLQTVCGFLEEASSTDFKTGFGAFRGRLPATSNRGKVTFYPVVMVMEVDKTVNYGFEDDDVETFREEENADVQNDDGTFECLEEFSHAFADKVSFTRLGSLSEEDEADITIQERRKTNSKGIPNGLSYPGRTDPPLTFSGDLLSSMLPKGWMDNARIFLPFSAFASE